MKSATTDYIEKKIEERFQSTHPVKSATFDDSIAEDKGAISIHAPREECDGATADTATTKALISIHAPREECDKEEQPYGRQTKNFNPRTP